MTSERVRETFGQEKTIGMVITRALDPKVKLIYLSWTQNKSLPLGSKVDILQPKAIEKANLVLLEFISLEDFEFIQEEFELERKKIERELRIEMGYRGISGDPPTSLVEAYAKNLLTFGAFLRKSSIKSFQVDFGTRYKPQIETINLQDLDTCLRLALNTVVLAVGTSREYAFENKTSERRDFNPQENSRSKTFSLYR